MYTRPGLSTRDRELAAVAALVALGRSSAGSAARAGVVTELGSRPAGLSEVILQTATVAGFPPAMNAMATAVKTIVGDEEA